MGLFGTTTLMVIKHNLQLFFLVLLASSSVLAQEIINEKGIEQLNAKIRLILDKANYEEAEEIFDENEELLKKNPSALELLALSYERRSKLNEAIKIYTDIIRYYHADAHKEVLKLKQGEITPKDKQNERLQFYYYKLSMLYIQMYQSSHIFTEKNEVARRKKLAQTAVDTAEKAGLDRVDLISLRESLNEKIKLDQSYDYQKNYFFTLQMTSWQQKMLLIKQSDGQKSELLTTNLGECLGGGFRYSNAYKEFELGICGGKANSTISSQTTQVNYQQADVNVTYLQIEPSFYSKHFSEFVLLGFQPVFFYTSGAWNVPSSDYNFEEKSNLRAGYHILAKVRMNRFEIITKFGKVFPNPSSNWILGLNYSF